MLKLPQDKGPDNTLAFLVDGYTYVSKRCRKLSTDIFQAHIMLRKVTCIMGEEAAREFYVPGRFTRQAAIPITTLLLLQDQGSALTLDGEAHRHRKTLLMSFMNREAIDRLVSLVEEEWLAKLSLWKGEKQIVLLHEVQEILCRAVVKWTGTPLVDAEAKERTREFAAMIDGAGSFGYRNLKGQIFRLNTEIWIKKLIEQIRNNEILVPEGSIAEAIALHKDLNGKLLSPDIAAIELINLLRPTVAIANYIVFEALALHQFSEARPKTDSADDYLNCFVQEVRRFYPFFPVVGGHVLNEFNWRGHEFQKGDWVFLDLYGTNHDERIWMNANEFKPERFRDWDGNPFTLIPQGGGADYNSTHRCAGELLTIAIMRKCLELLTQKMSYELPEQNLTYSLSRFPSIPESRFLMNNIRKIHV